MGPKRRSRSSPTNCTKSTTGFWKQKTSTLITRPQRCLPRDDGGFTDWDCPMKSSKRSTPRMPPDFLRSQSKGAAFRAKKRRKGLTKQRDSARKKAKRIIRKAKERDDAFLSPRAPGARPPPRQWQW